MKKLLAILALLLAPFSTNAVELTGSVSFENGLYTYSYELSASDYQVTQVLVLVNSTGGDFDLHPVSYNSPTDWLFNTHVGVNPNYAGYLPAATYFGWELFGVVGGLEPVSGFSFTTSAPPAAAPVAVTYLLFAPAYQGGDDGLLHNFYLGSVVAPDFLVEPPSAVVPEPASYAMLLLGLGLLGYIARRRLQA